MGLASNEKVGQFTHNQPTWNSGGWLGLWCDRRLLPELGSENMMTSGGRAVRGRLSRHWGNISSLWLGHFPEAVGALWLLVPTQNLMYQIKLQVARVGYTVLNQRPKGSLPNRLNHSLLLRLFIIFYNVMVRLYLWVHHHLYHQIWRNQAGIKLECLPLPPRIPDAGSYCKV